MRSVPPLSPVFLRLSLGIAPVSLALGNGFLGDTAFVGGQGASHVHHLVELAVFVATHIPFVTRLRFNQLAGTTWFLCRGHWLVRFVAVRFTGESSKGG